MENGLNATARTREELWEPRRALTLAQAHRRTQLVGVLRMVFTAGAGVSAGVILGYVAMQAFTSFNASAPPPAAGVTMLNPRFTGRDAGGQLYVITAKTARQSRGDAYIVNLDEPVIEDGLGTVVSASTGVYDRDARKLELDGNVELLDVSGYRFVSESAIMHVDTNEVTGKTPLEGWGPLGRVRADTYTVVDGGTKVVLTGNVWTKLEFEDSK